jgi:hypothetical protein
LNIAAVQALIGCLPQKVSAMDERKTVEDVTADRLHALSARLKECLVDAENVRARFTKAHDTNAWPDLASVGRRRFDDTSKAE